MSEPSVQDQAFVAGSVDSAISDKNDLSPEAAASDGRPDTAGSISERLTRYGAYDRLEG